ncbi:YbaY family lipoprotein [Bradyrhizobium huanghuaihaiense]|uniref:YbaY family lipoprotein n=1 Tax=Bradyrhizobium huanghuaihaiense TaxID=990078 RepID=UPI0021AA9BC7|nr:YbaY family lipoprotein [Bradyrhizobium sp. CB3035]UWU76627.1 YbaY family lipoprotein [Bradyrhizobium sp. CB3035]
MEITGTLRVTDRGEVGALRGIVRLEDVTLADARSRVIATGPIVLQQGEDEGRFSISIPDDIERRAQYILSARLEGEHLQTGRACVFGTVVAYPWQPHDPPQDHLIVARRWTRQSN